MEMGSTSGVNSSIIVRISRPTRAYLAMSGLMTVASRQSASALNMGIAERTPWVRAM